MLEYKLSKNFGFRWKSLELEWKFEIKLIESQLQNPNDIYFSKLTKF